MGANDFPKWLLQEFTAELTLPFRHIKTVPWSLASSLMPIIFQKMYRMLGRSRGPVRIYNYKFRGVSKRSMSFLFWTNTSFVISPQFEIYVGTFWESIATQLFMALHWGDLQWNCANLTMELPRTNSNKRTNVGCFVLNSLSSWKTR